MVKAHIFPIGFFSGIEPKGPAITYKESGKKGRRLQKAIYDSEIICENCEKDIFSPLDDYAIRILRDKCHVVETIAKEDIGLLIFDDKVDKRRLRKFFASILWRVSISTQLELADTTIGEHYQQRIGSDLLRNGEFDYVDVFVILLTDPMHNVFFMPCECTLDINGNRANGWSVQFPNIDIKLSLDQRKHPIRSFLEFEGKKISSSLHPIDSSEYLFFVLEQKTLQNREDNIFRIIEKIRHS